MTRQAARTFTGRHMAAELVGFFAVVIAVNVLMATLASSTFGGVVVPNSYVASQQFNGWLEAARAQEQLGWSAQAERAPDGHVVVMLAGAPGDAALQGEARHPLGRMADRALTFRRHGDAYRSDESLPAGRWRIRLEAVAGASRWRAEEIVS